MVKPRVPSQQHGHPTSAFRGSTGSTHNTRKIPEKYRKRQKQERVLVLYIGILAVILIGGIGFLVYLLQTDPVKNRHSQLNKQKTLAQRVSDVVQQSSNTIRGRSANNDDLQTAMWEQLETLEESMQRNERFPNEHFQSLPRFHRLLPALRPKEPQNPLLTATERSKISKFSMHGPYFRVSRMKGTLSDHGSTPMAWEQEWEHIQAKRRDTKLVMDYTLQEHYLYPRQSLEPPPDGYPTLRSLRQLFSNWPQDELDSPPFPLVETLQHFDFRDPEQLAIAELYREHEVPFKLTNVPELMHANQKWTDEYVSQGFDALRPQQQRPSHADIPSDGVHPNQVPPQGKCQEAPHNYFAFFQPTAWNVEKMGIPPTRNNDWTFWKWSQHARYADAVQLDASKPHFYWQAGVPKEEREVKTHNQQTSTTDDEYPNPRASFISRDLFPAFSSPNATFICPDPSQQKGIQCRFGERGVVAAVHYDSGKNMVGMIEGAKRYVLLPPNQCRHLGIVTLRQSPVFRHSILNLGHVVDPPRGEQHEWLQRAGRSLAVETVLKAGEVLYIPSHWFHYIIGLQKNAQCNVRSGVDTQGSKEFGGALDVLEPLCDPRADL